MRHKGSITRWMVPLAVLVLVVSPVFAEEELRILPGELDPGDFDLKGKLKIN